MTALRHNAGKARVDWLPPDTLMALGSLMGDQMGEGKKYPARNWEKGMPHMTVYASLLRHLFAWANGEDVDPESGHLHAAHVHWNAMALHTYLVRGIGEDNRPGSQ